MKKLFATISCIVMLVLSLFCGSTGLLYANADETAEPVPRVYATDVSVIQGSSVSVTVKAENFESVGSFELFVYYDSTALSVTSSSATGLLSSEIYSIDTATVGEAEMFVASASGAGISGSGNLWKLTFKANTNAMVGSYPITIAVGEANAADFQPVSINADNFYITVNEKPTAVKTTTFRATTPSSIKEGESTSISYYTTSSNNFSSAEFELNYDDTLLVLDSVTVGNALKNVDGAIYSVNDTIDGYIKISFAATAGVASYISSSNPLFTLRFTAKENVSASAEVIFNASSMYDVDFNPINSNTVTSNVSLIYVEPVVELPKIFVEGYNGYDKTFTVDIVAEKETLLAVGDFVVTYNSAMLSCLSAVKADENATVVSNIKKDENGEEIGEIKFSFIYSVGINSDTVLIRLTFNPKGIGETTIGFIGTDFYNSAYGQIEAECFGSKIVLDHELEQRTAKEPTCTEVGWNAYEKCKNCTYSTYNEKNALGHNYKSVITAPTCTEQGYTTYTCHCGDSYISDYVNANGHRFDEWYETLDPTCLYKGEKRRDCSVCEYYETEEIVALGHDKVYYETQEPTCTEIGWDSYETCTRCEYTTYKERAVLGHNYETQFTIDKEPTCTEKGSKSYHCLRCQSLSQITEIPAKGHTMDEWKQTIVPSCSAMGEERRDCSVCEYFETQSLGRLDHVVLNHSAKEPTCTEVGWNAYETCANCSYTTYVEKPALGHSYEKAITLPTCTEQGYTTYTCHCGDSYIADYVNSTGHHFGEWVVIQEATTKQKGIKERECSCGHKETEDIPLIIEDVEKPSTSDTDIDKEEPKRGCGSVVGPSLGMSFLVIGVTGLLVYRKRKR